MCTSRCLRTLLLAALAASSLAACKDDWDGVCANAAAEDVPGSALLQTQKSATAAKRHVSEPSSSPVSAHLAESSGCIPAAVQEAHLTALRNHAALLSSGARAPGKKGGQRPHDAAKNACSGKPTASPAPDASNNCEMMVNGQNISGKCMEFGMDGSFCEIGQFEACKKSNQGGGEGDTCNFQGMSGKCSYATGYPTFDQYNNPSGTVTVYACDMEAPGATPAPTQPPTDPLTQGASASLDASGFKAVTSLCCPSEMETFFNRLLAKMGLQVCSKPHVQGLMHWFTCVPDMDFQYMLDVINDGNPCKYWAPEGSECPSLTPACAGSWCR